MSDINLRLQAALADNSAAEKRIKELEAAIEALSSQLDHESAVADMYLQGQQQFKERIKQLENALRPFAQSGDAEWDPDPNRVLLMTTRGEIRWDDLIEAAKVIEDE